jgi:hypothetical protein
VLFFAFTVSLARALTFQHYCCHLSCTNNRGSDRRRDSGCHPQPDRKRIARAHLQVRLARLWPARAKGGGDLSTMDCAFARRRWWWCTGRCLSRRRSRSSSARSLSSFAARGRRSKTSAISITRYLQRTPQRSRGPPPPQCNHDLWKKLVVVALEAHMRGEWW